MAGSRAVVLIALIFLAAPTPVTSWGLNGGDYCGPDYAPRFLTEHGQKNKEALCTLVNVFQGTQDGKPITPEEAGKVLGETYTPKISFTISPGSAQFAHGGLEKYFGTFDGITSGESANIWTAGISGIMMSNIKVQDIGVVTETNGAVLDVVFTYTQHAPAGVDVAPLENAYMFVSQAFTDDNKIHSITIIKNTLWIQKVWDAVHPAGSLAVEELVENDWKARSAVARSEKAPTHYCGPDYKPRHFTLYGAQNKLSVCKLIEMIQGKTIAGKVLTPKLMQEEFSDLFASEITFIHWPDTKDLFTNGPQYFGTFKGPAMKVFQEAIVPGIRWSDVTVENLAVVTENSGRTILGMFKGSAQGAEGAPAVKDQLVGVRYSFDADGKISEVQVFDNPMYLHAYLGFEKSAATNDSMQLAAPVLSGAGYFAMGMLSMGLAMVAYTRFGRKVTPEGTSYEALIA